MPGGTALVTAKGIPAVEAALAMAPAEIAGQATPFLAMAQSMAVPGADGELVWKIDATQPGTLLVNGVDMMGGP